MADFTVVGNDHKREGEEEGKGTGGQEGNCWEM